MSKHNFKFQNHNFKNSHFQVSASKSMAKWELNHLLEGVELHEIWYLHANGQPTSCKSSHSKQFVSPKVSLQN
uniref:Putative ovule protein n=1 Tax=Solanum chacoense TaxID=4108 RepID=A0A0V0HYS0_SOLCH